jgi:glycosyltransferase involved in cell wall biosynthesis
MAAELSSLPAVTVIMPVLNEEGHLAAAAGSILAQDYSGVIELILALGPSKDDTDRIAAELAAADSRVVLMPNPKGLTTVGMNAAIKIAKHDYIVRIDAHSEPAQGYIAKGITELLNVGADLIGGIMDAKGKSAFQRAVAWAYTSKFGIGGARYHVGGEAGEAESAYLGIFKKSALERVGGYDEAIIRGEDWDLAQRIKQTGGLVWFSPELKVTYWPRGRWGKLAKQFYSTGVWRGDLTRRDLKRASKRYFAPPVLVLVLVLSWIDLLDANPVAIVPTAAYLLGVAHLAITASGLRLKDRVALLVVLPTMHLSWGWGFIRGYLVGAGMTIDRSRMNKEQVK